MRVNFNKWWLLPVGILVCCAMASLNIVVFGSSFVARSSAEPAPLGAGASEAGGGCSGALASDYACYQERYQDLVRDSDVKAAFAELKDEYEKNEFVKSNCHQMTHVIGRAAAERYGDIPSAYSRGEHFCGTGYYHGVMEDVVAKMGADKVVEEADTLCAELREREPRSDYHYACAHGLGHGFMAMEENEVFEALQTCDALADGWEKDHCFGGVFMENVVAQDDPAHPSKYLKADQPLYPCTVVEARHKPMCYLQQLPLVLDAHGDNHAKVLDLCATVEDEGRPSCYGGVAAFFANRAIKTDATDVAQIESVKKLCNRLQDYEAKSHCVSGAASELTYRLRSDTQAKAFCESFKNEDLRARCLQVVEQRSKDQKS